ncbi:protein SHORT-ROOT 1-like [Musa acuminata AAA Group]|uniref:protein SHORT-ROOT 1-like n=1 Tax=Musa acuminata AAA Group TaxID=214697 RepID=UPI0031E1E6C0
MDAVFRLFRLQTSDPQSCQNSSSKSSKAHSKQQHHHHYYIHTSSLHQQEQCQEECGVGRCHLYMDEEDFSSSSSSSKHHRHRPLSASASASTTPTPTPLFNPNDLSLLRDLSLDFSPASSSSANASSAGGRLASHLLPECARAVAERNSQRVQQLMWMLNELSTPYGDVDQKLASYFLQGLFARLTSSGPRTLLSLSAASDHNCSFDSTRRTALRFQELSPWSSFGHVAANGAILESFLQSSSSSRTQRFHILDLSNTFCTQWPTLLEALATRSSDDTPHLSITTVVSSPSSSSSSAPSSSMQRVMKEIGQRMEKFARLMGVPFRFNVVNHPGNLLDLDLDRLDLREGGAAALAVNCVNTLHGVSPAGCRRDTLFAAFRRLQPRILTIVEEEAELDAAAGGEEDRDAFLKVFGESLRFFSAYYETLEESFPRTSNERLALERAAGRAVVDLVSCPAAESTERRDTAAGWSRRMQAAGFEPAQFSDDVADDARALLRRYRKGWSMRVAEVAGRGAGIFLEWKEQPVVWASAWKP